MSVLDLQLLPLLESDRENNAAAGNAALGAGSNISNLAMMTACTGFKPRRTSSRKA